MQRVAINFSSVFEGSLFILALIRNVFTPVTLRYFSVILVIPIRNHYIANRHISIPTRRIAFTVSNAYNYKQKENIDEKSRCFSKEEYLCTWQPIHLAIGSLFASSNPDGLEWSLFGNADAGYSANMGLDEEDFGVSSTVADKAADIQEKTAFLPDYAFASDEENPVGTSVSGILGGAMVAVVAVVICLAGGFFRKRKMKTA